MRKHWIFGVAVLVWYAMIFSLTASPASTSKYTSSIIKSETNASPVLVHKIDVMVRKGAHVAVFGILAILVQLALRKRSNAVLLAWFVATLCGAADEFHQTLVPNRTPSIIDIGIDSLGAAAALLLFHIMRHIVARIIRKSDAEF